MANGNRKSGMRTWRATSRDVARMVDALGRPDDSGIRRTVVALRALGFRTRASGQGHLDHGKKAPWIDIGTETKILRSDGKVAQASWRNSPELRRSRDLNLEAQQRLIDLLERFYRGRAVAVAMRLILISQRERTIRRRRGATRLLRFAGIETPDVYFPVPSSFTVCGLLFASLSSIVIAPDCLPIRAGVKVTETVHCWPGSKVCAHGLEAREKLPSAVSFMTTTGWALLPCELFLIFTALLMPE
jgi:hypothetical protein